MRAVFACLDALAFIEHPADALGLDDLWRPSGFVSFEPSAGLCGSSCGEARGRSRALQAVEGPVYEDHQVHDREPADEPGQAVFGCVVAHDLSFGWLGGMPGRAR